MEWTDRWRKGWRRRRKGRRRINGEGQEDEEERKIEGNKGEEEVIGARWRAVEGKGSCGRRTETEACVCRCGFSGCTAF